VLQRKRLKTAKRRAKTWKQAMSGENGQASLKLTWTRTLPHVTAEMPENGEAKGEKVVTGKRRFLT
jgi:hypothetical protein